MNAYSRDDTKPEPVLAEPQTVDKQASAAHLRLEPDDPLERIAAHVEQYCSSLAVAKASFDRRNLWVVTWNSSRESEYQESGEVAGECFLTVLLNATIRAAHVAGRTHIDAFLPSTERISESPLLHAMMQIASFGTEYVRFWRLGDHWKVEWESSNMGILTDRVGQVEHSQLGDAVRRAQARVVSALLSIAKDVTPTIGKHKLQPEMAPINGLQNVDIGL